MPHHSITVTAYRADNIICPSNHQHTTGGNPFIDGCTGRARALATRACEWTNEDSSNKGYAAELGKRHRAQQCNAQSLGSMQTALPGALR